MSDDAEQDRVRTYAAWVRQLRSGDPVPPLDTAGEDALARLGGELQLLADTFIRRDRELSQLFDLVETVERGVLLDDVLDRIFDSFAGLIPYDRIGCAFLSDNGSHVEAHWARTNLGTLQISAGYAQPLAGSSLEDVLRTGRPRILNDLRAYLEAKPDSEATQRIVAEGGHSSLTCPLIVDQAAIGFLFFTSRERDAYHERHQSVFARIAGQVSIVIHRSRLYQQVVDRNHQLVQDSHRLEQVARSDALTGMLNRGAVVARIELALTDAIRSRTGLGLVLADIDRFKQINDRFGHDAGDQALREFTRRMTSVLRDSDTLGRYGGDEFLVVVPHATQDVLRFLAERLRVAVANAPFKLAGRDIHVTASFGTALCDWNDGSARPAIAAADRALYEAKAGGRNRVVAG